MSFWGFAIIHILAETSIFRLIPLIYLFQYEVGAWKLEVKFGDNKFTLWFFCMV